MAYRHQLPSQKQLANCTVITLSVDQDIKRNYLTKSHPSRTIREFKWGTYVLSARQSAMANFVLFRFKPLVDCFK